MDQENNNSAPPLGVMPEHYWLTKYLEAKEQGAIALRDVLRHRICELTRAINGYTLFKLKGKNIYLIEIWAEELLRRISDLKPLDF